MNGQLPRVRQLQFINGVLASCVLLGIACRFIGLNWDSGFHLHPDERFLTMTTEVLRWPHSWPEYFASAHAPLNPFNHHIAFYVYGQFPLMLVKGLADILHHNDYDDLVLIGRFLSALFDTLSVLLVYLIGNRIRNCQSFGLLCAAFYALTALCIQQAHFFVADTFAATFIVAAFHCALRASTAGMRAWLFDVLCGLCLGAALACKFSSVLFVVAIIAFLVARQRKGTEWQAPAICCLFAAFLAFRILHPIAFRGEGGALTLWGLLDVRPHNHFWNAIAQQATITSGAVDAPFNLQWFDRTAFLYPLWNLGGWAIGWPLLICAIGGTLLVATRVLRRHPMPLSIVVSALWLATVFLFYGAQFSKFTRYYLPALPFVALLAAWLLFESWHATSHRKAKVVIALGSAGVLLCSLFWSLAVTSIYTRVHSRVAATQWILQNIPTGTAIANETTWDDALPLRHAQRYRMHDLGLFEVDSAQKRERMLQTLNDVQWIFVSSPRVWKTIPRLPQRFPLTAQYYRALFDGSLGFERARAFSSYPQLLGKAFPDENFEEALLVYDHPRVLLFRKTAEYSASKAARLLSKKLSE